MNDVIYSLWLKNAVTQKRARQLLELYGGAENVYSCTDYRDADFLNEKHLSRLMDKSLDPALEILGKCSLSDLHIITPTSPMYPPQLLDIEDYPTVLFAKGIVPDWESILPIGIVGTRKLSAYGQEVTECLCRELMDSGATIVSGFALGVDAIAAATAIKMGLPTVAVLGCGADVVYPPSHKGLYEKVLEKGVFLSEFLPGEQAKHYNFPQRNRIISGISRGVVVTEAPEKSGAVITAQLAAKQGRDVFSVPGRVTSPSSAGTNLLIKEGAITVLSSGDIISKYPELQNKPPVPKQAAAGISDPILNALSTEEMNIDELAAKTGLGITDCNSRCFMLELEGKIKKLPGNYYHII